MSHLIKKHYVIYTLFKSKIAQAANSKWHGSSYRICGTINFAASPGFAKNSLSLCHSYLPSLLRCEYPQSVLMGEDGGTKKLININNEVNKQMLPRAVQLLVNNSSLAVYDTKALF